MNASPTSSRRVFLIRAVVGLGALQAPVTFAGSVVGPAAAPAAASAWNGQIETLTEGILKGVLGSRFRVLLDTGQHVDLRLVQVRNIAFRRGRATEAVDESVLAQREPFSILLHGREGARLAQDTYRVEHASLGSLSILLVPVGPPQSVVKYEAIFG